MGRPSKLDDLREKRICDALRRGHSYAAAARAGGIDESTLHEWRARGRAGEQRYAEFVERVDRADSEAEHRALEVLTAKFDSPDERIALNAVMFWFERRRPAEWGKPTAPANEAPAAHAESDADDTATLESLLAAAKSRRSGTDG